MTREAHLRQKRLVEMSLLRVGVRNNEKPQKGSPEEKKRRIGLKTS